VVANFPLQAKKFARLMNAPQINTLVIDSRTWNEFIGYDREIDAPSIGRVAGAVWACWNTLLANDREEFLDRVLYLTGNRRNVTILLYCRAGARSQNASRFLAANGFLNVLDFGGTVTTPWTLSPLVTGEPV